jgi:hypothetical protein
MKAYSELNRKYFKFIIIWLERSILNSLLEASYCEDTPDTGLYDKYDEFISLKELENSKKAASNPTLANPNLPPFPDSLPGEPFGDSELAVSPIPGFP